MKKTILAALLLLLPLATFAGGWTINTYVRSAKALEEDKQQPRALYLCIDWESKEEYLKYGYSRYFGLTLERMMYKANVRPGGWWTGFDHRISKHYWTGDPGGGDENFTCSQMERKYNNIINITNLLPRKHITKEEYKRIEERRGRDSGAFTEEELEPILAAILKKWHPTKYERGHCGEVAPGKWVRCEPLFDTMTISVTQ